MKDSDNMKFCKQIETLPFTKQQKAALLGQAEMTCDLLWECLSVYSSVEDTETFFALCDQYPELVEEKLRQFDGKTREERTKESWERFKKRMTEEYGEDWFSGESTD